MAYPQTKFQIVDNSDITPLNVVGEDDIKRGVFVQVFAAPKGPEEWKTGVMGQKFFDLYGTKPTFGTYGQPLLQASEIARLGGRVTAKRVVAPNATLADLLVYAEVYKATVQKYDKAGGNPIYLDSNGNETIDPTQADASNGVNGCATVQKAHVLYKAVPFGNDPVSTLGNNFKMYRNAVRADASYSASATPGVAGEIDISGNVVTPASSVGAVYPLFIIGDNGRGASAKTIRIYADTSARRPVDYVRYIMTVSDEGNQKETLAFTLNPDRIESNRNMSLENITNTKSLQIRTLIFEDETKAFIQNMAYLSGIPYDDYINHDILFGLDTYGLVEKTIEVDPAGAEFDATNGLALLGGTNGSFGDNPLSPANVDAYNAQIVSAFDGSFSDEIYDLDNFPAYVIFDADYDPSIKRKIEEWVEFRDDVFYFRDMGTGLTTMDAIKLANTNNLASRSMATYENSWDIVDPYTRKQITVTATYSLARLFVQHYLDGPTRPFCGQLYKITFPDVIEGTVNFVPKNTPSEDQKQTIDDMRINYASYYSGVLVMETEYTSQARYTELSWINNVIALQELIRKIRVKCPKIRYNYMDSDSLEKYMKDVQQVIDNESNNFDSITMRYVADNVYEQNKIFYAEIEVKTKQFNQSEFFKITVVKG